MKGEDLLKIIGTIDDKYIRECEEYKPRDKRKIFAVAKYVAAAASLCLLVASFVLLVRIDNRGGRGYNTSTLLSGAFMGPHKDVLYYDEWYEDFLSSGNLLWEDMCSGTDGGAENNSTGDMISGAASNYFAITAHAFYGSSRPVDGYVCITEKLSDMYRDIRDNNKNVLIAVYVEELTGVSSERVYDEFIAPLNVSEDYMRTRIIYISPEQMVKLTCPKDMKIVLDVVRK